MLSRYSRALSLITFTAFVALVSVLGQQSIRPSGIFSEDTPLSIVRDGAALSALPDGRMLLTGGVDMNGNALASAEFLVTGASAGQMTTARSAHLSVTLKDGRVLVAGGRTIGGGVTGSAEIYDPASGLWNSVSALLSPRTGATATLLNDGRVLITGGSDGASPLRTSEVFSPSTGTFALSADLSSPRQNHAAALLNDGRVALVGGSDGNQNLNTIEIYDPVANSISVLPQALSIPRSGLSATTLMRGKVLVAGGTASGAATAETEIIDVAAGTVEPGPAMSTARSGHLAILLPNNNTVLMASGASASAGAEIYIPWQNTFAAFGSLVNPRMGAAGGASGKTGLAAVAGGQVSGAASASVETVHFPMVLTDKADYQPGNTAAITGSGFAPSETVSVDIAEAPDDGDGPHNFTVTTDAAGMFTATFPIDHDDLNIRFYLTAKGGSSGLTAGMTFTDGAPFKVQILASTGASGGTFDIDYINNGTQSKSAGQTTPLQNISMDPSAAGSISAFSISNIAPLVNGLQFTGAISVTTSSSDISTLVTGSATIAGGIVSGTTGASGNSMTITLIYSAKTTPVFSNLSSPVITYGVASTALTGTVTGTGTTPPTGSVTVTLNGVSQTTSLIAGSGNAATFSSTFATGGLTVSGSPYPVAYHYGGDSKYNAISPDGNGSLTVNPASVTPAISVSSKIYDKTATATATCSLTGVLAADTGNVTCSPATAAFASSNVGSWTVNATGISLSGSAAGNYTLSSTTASTTASITARAITVTATASNKVYDGNTASASVPTVTAGSLANGDTASWTETYDNRNVGTTHVMTPAGTVSDGNNGANYAVTFAAINSGVITARPITVTAAASSKVYDGTTSSTGVPTITAGSLASPDTASWIEVYDNKNVGTAHVMTPSGSISDANGGANYSITFVPIGTGVITARPLTVTAVGVNKIYDGTTAATVTLSDDRLAADTVTDSYTTAVFATKNVGTGITVNVSGISISGSGAGNYALTSTTATASANITTRSLTVTATGVNKTYDGTLAATVTLSDDHLGSDAVTDNYTSAVFVTKNAGTGITINVSGISLSGTDSGNYALTNQTATTSANIAARAITVTAAASNKVYDGNTASASIPTITSGSLASGDTASWTEVYDNKNVGTTHVMTPSGSILDGNGGANYSITFASIGTGVITARTLTVTAVGVNKIYDGSTTATVTLSDDHLGADAVTESYTSAVFITKNAGTGITINVSGISLSGADSGNYALSSTSATASANITTRPLTVTATGVNKTYDGTLTATVTLSDDHLGSDAVIDNYASAVFITKNAGTGITINVSGISLSGADSGNYALTNQTATASANIAVRAITVTAGASNKIYDGNTTSAGTPAITVGSLAPGDTASWTETYDNRNVGTTHVMTPAGTVSDGNNGANYAITFATLNSGVITARPIKVTAAASSKVYDGTTSSLGIPTITVGSLASPDTASWTEAYDNKNVGNAHVMSPSGSVSDGNGGANYIVTFQSISTGIITPLAIGVMPVGQTVNFGIAPQPFTYKISSGALLAGDSLGTAVFTFNGSATVPIAVGSYTLAVTGLANPNYAISASTSLFTINRDVMSLVFTGTDQGPASTTLTDLTCATSVSARLDNLSLGGSVPGALVSFTLTGGNPAITPLVVSGTTDATGNVKVQCPVNLPPGPYTLTIAYAGSATLADVSLTQPVTIIANPHIAPSPGAGTLYTGSRFVWTTSPTTSTATLALSATIQDSMPCIFTDITKATVSFSISSDGGNTFSPVTNAQNLPVGLVDPSNHALGTASASSQYNLGKNLSASLWVRVTVGGEYSYSADTFDVPVIVAVPGQVNTLLAGGQLNNDGASVAGPTGFGASGYLGTAAETTNEAAFGGTVTYSKSLSNPQGQLNVTIHSRNKVDGTVDTVSHTYWAKSNSITGMNITGKTAGTSTASFTAKYNLYETTGGVKTGLDSGAQMQFTFTPNGGVYTVTTASGASQSFTCSNSNGCASIVIFRSAGGVWFSSAWGSVSGLAQTLEKGLAPNTGTVSIQ